MYNETRTPPLLQVVVKSAGWKVFPVFFFMVISDTRHPGPEHSSIFVWMCIVYVGNRANSYTIVGEFKKGWVSITFVMSLVGQHVVLVYRYKNFRSVVTTKSSGTHPQ